MTQSDPSARTLDALSPCPFCGSQNVDPQGWATLPEYANTPEERYGPACDDCGASAPTIAIWNTRAQPQGAPAGAEQTHAAREKAFDQWWYLLHHNGLKPRSEERLAREAYYAAWGGGCPPAPPASSEPMKALAVFAEAADNLDDDHEDASSIWESSAAMSITAGDLRRAQKVMLTEALAIAIDAEKITPPHQPAQTEGEMK